MQLTKSKGLNALLEKIEAIDVTAAKSVTLTSYMEATKLLDEFTKSVKAEMVKRLKGGEELQGFRLGTRKTETIEDEEIAVKYLESKGFDIDEIYDSRLKSAKELKGMLSIKDRDGLPVKESTSTFVTKDRKKA